LPDNAFEPAAVTVISAHLNEEWFVWIELNPSVIIPKATIVIIHIDIPRIDNVALVLFLNGFLISKLNNIFFPFLKNLYHD